MCHTIMGNYNRGNIYFTFQEDAFIILPIPQARVKEFR